MLITLQVPDLDAIVVPVGGGGMLSGICIAAKGIKPSIRIFAAEPLNADDCAKSFAAGKRIPLPGMCLHCMSFKCHVIWISIHGLN